MNNEAESQNSDRPTEWEVHLMREETARRQAANQRNMNELGMLHFG